MEIVSANVTDSFRTQCQDGDVMPPAAMPTIRILEAGPIVKLANGTEFPSHVVVSIFRSPPPGLQIALEVFDGKPKPTQLVIGLPLRDSPTSSGMVPLPLAIFRALDIENLVEQITGYLGEYVIETAALASGDITRLSDLVYARAGLRPDAAAELDAARRGAVAMLRRRTIGDELLREVADIVRLHPKKSAEAVASKMSTGVRNASRWIAKAREGGFLEDGDE